MSTLTTNDDAPGPEREDQYSGELRRLFVWFGVVLSLIFVDQAGHALSGWSLARLRLQIAYLLPLLGFGLAFRVGQLAFKERPATSRRFGLWGIGFIVGGATFDLFATLYHNPSLSLEANPYIRVLLDSGHSLPAVYAMTVITQVAFVTVFVAVWTAFLRHLPRLVATISHTQPRSGVQFLKAATGGGHLTVRQWLLPLKLTEMPDLYHWFWAIAIPVVFGSTLFRWYVGLEWFDVVQPSLLGRGVVMLIGIVAAQTVYFMALWGLFRRETSGLRPTDTI